MRRRMRVTRKIERGMHLLEAPVGQRQKEGARARTHTHTHTQTCAGGWTEAERGWWRRGKAYAGKAKSP